MRALYEVEPSVDILVVSSQANNDSVASQGSPDDGICESQRVTDHVRPQCEMRLEFLHRDFQSLEAEDSKRFEPFDPFSDLV